MRLSERVGEMHPVWFGQTFLFYLMMGLCFDV